MYSLQFTEGQPELNSQQWNSENVDNVSTPQMLLKAGLCYEDRIETFSCTSVWRPDTFKGALQWIQATYLLSEMDSIFVNIQTNQRDEQHYTAFNMQVSFTVHRVGNQYESNIFCSSPGLMYETTTTEKKVFCEYKTINTVCLYFLLIRNSAF